MANLEPPNNCYTNNIELDNNLEKRNTFSTKKNIASVFLVGMLSMMFAEVMAGSSNTWFFDPFGWAITFLLYLGHVIFYLNVAVKIRRTSVYHLYLFGMLFALYEAPITQVLWSGYMDDPNDPRKIILGIALIEFVILVFFWHPIMSFIIPVLMFESLIIESAKIHGITSEIKLKNMLLPGHYKILQNLKKKKSLFFVFLFIISANQITATGFNILSAEMAYMGTMLLVFIFYKKSEKNSRNIGKPLSIQNLILTENGFKKLIIFLIFYIYIFGTFLISSFLPGRFPKEPVAYISIILVVLTIIIIIKFSVPNISESQVIDEFQRKTNFDTEKHLGKHSVLTKKTENQVSENQVVDYDSLFSSHDLWTLFGILIFGEIFFGLLGNVAIIVMSLFYFSMLFIGFYIFMKVLLAIRKKTIFH